jgi:aspartate/methionine/tyrosine aminotransferase
VLKSPVRRETGWKPVFNAGGVEGITEAELRTCRLMWVNYPSNPTAASADVRFYERAIECCERRAKASGASGPIILASDLAYSELYLDGERSRPPSMWQAGNADIEKTGAIEFHSLSKTFNMTGWRIGFAVGHADVIAALQSVKSNVDSGTFNAIQEAGADAPALPRSSGRHRPGLARHRLRAGPAGFGVLCVGPNTRARGQGAGRPFPGEPDRFDALRGQVPGRGGHGVCPGNGVQRDRTIMVPRRAHGRI